MLKELAGSLLQWLPIWSLPINVIVAMIAAKEGAQNHFPAKTIALLIGFAVVIGLLIAAYTLA